MLYTVTAGRPSAEVCGHIHAQRDAETLDDARASVDALRAAGHQSVSIFHRDTENSPFRYSSSVSGPGNGLCAACMDRYAPSTPEAPRCFYCGQLVSVRA